MVEVDAAVRALQVAYDADRPSLLRRAVRDFLEAWEEYGDE